MADGPSLVLTVPSDPRMLPVTRSFLEAACQVGNLDRTTTYAVVLAAAEAITNVIRHAHRNRPGAPVQVQYRLLPEAVEVVVLDEGDPFDISAVPHLDPSEMRLGGRGVYLMRKLMDQISSAPRPGQGNVLRMVKRRPALRDAG